MSESTEGPGVICVLGAGAATGTAIARRFAREGFTACVARRQPAKLEPFVESIRAEGGAAHAFGCDATDPAAVAELVARVEAEVGPITVACYNAAVGVRAPVVELDPEDYERVWRINAFGAFLFGREVARRMTDRGHGTLLFTGATSALRGRAGFSAFAGSKHALRALAQAMARELHPQNIHVAHVVIDGPIDTPLIRRRMPEVFEERPADGVLRPDDIAESYWMLHRQPRSAWSHEIDLRPWVEPW